MNIHESHLKPTMKNTYPEDSDKLLDCKKQKRLNPLEPLLAVLGFVFIALFFIGCLFYLDYRSVTSRLRDCSGSSLGLVASDDAAVSMNERSGFLDEGGEECDVFDGNWVWDDGYPLYQSADCPFIDGGFRCLENGRPDNFFTKWRWQPKNCKLPRFDARNMLEKLRNRRLVFVGDSIGRSQWESMLCMLASAVSDKSSIYEVNGNPISKHKGFLVFKFEDYNCTVEYYRAPFLVVQGSPPPGAPKEVRMTLRVDKMTWTSKQWRDADVILFNSGHWWNYGKTLGVGCYFQEEMEVKMNMSIETAFKRSIETFLDFIDTEIDTSKTQVLFRTYAPAHYRGGDWNSGGQCHLEKLPDFGPLPNTTEKHVQWVSEVVSERFDDLQASNLEFLYVTNMTQRRKDGHSSLYHLGPGNGIAPIHHQDCSHWCLPGVPDSWNEFLYAFFLKHESTRL